MALTSDSQRAVKPGPDHAARTLRRSILVAASCAVVVTGGCSRPHTPRTITVAYSNDLHGEIRSCGCVVKDYGGLGRRATFLNAVRDTTGDFLLLDGGDIFSSSVNYGREKADLTLKSMAHMGYHGVVVGERDFGFGTEYIRKRPREVGLPVLVANLFDAAGDTLVFPPKREITLPSGLKVGLLGVMGRGTRFPAQVPAGSLVVRDPVSALRPHIDEMRPRVGLVVVLAHMEKPEARQLAEALPGIDLIIYGHNGLPLKNAQHLGNAYGLQTGDRGRYMGVAFAGLGSKKPIAWLTTTAVALDKVYADDEAIAKLFQVYDMDIAAEEKGELPAATAAPANAEKERFVGAPACQPCHAAIYDQWSGTKHAHAFETLTGKERQFDRDCTPCHSTGFYEAGGFLSATATPGLTSVQCESCHGRGEAHARDPAVKTSREARSACAGCHTAERSPDFAFDEFWARLANCKGASAGTQTSH